MINMAHINAEIPEKARPYFQKYDRLRVEFSYQRQGTDFVGSVKILLLSDEPDVPMAAVATLDRTSKTEPEFVEEAGRIAQNEQLLNTLLLYEAFGL